jgi:hypothetical protein
LINMAATNKSVSTMLVPIPILIDPKVWTA